MSGVFAALWQSCADERTTQPLRGVDRTTGSVRTSAFFQSRHDGALEDNVIPVSDELDRKYPTLVRGHAGWNALLG